MTRLHALILRREVEHDGARAVQDVDNRKSDTDAGRNVRRTILPINLYGWCGIGDAGTVMDVLSPLQTVVVGYIFGTKGDAVHILI